MVLLRMQIPFFILAIIFITTCSFPVSFSQRDVTLFRNCSSVFSCGSKFPNILYPFWGGNRSSECGEAGLRLTCVQDDLLTINISGQIFRVLDINDTNYAVTIAANSLWDDRCANISASISPFNLFGVDAANFRLCPGTEDQDPRHQYSCMKSSENDRRADYHFSESDCPSGIPITIPSIREEVEEFKKSSSSMNLTELLYEGFKVEYPLNWTSCIGCKLSSGLCWPGTNSQDPTCLCPDGSHDSSMCRGKSNTNLLLKIGIALGASAVTAIIAAFLFLMYKRRQTRRTNSSSTLLSTNYSSYSSSALDPEKCISNFGVHIFDYYELEEATNNFDPERELGDGGFGTVYKGKLKDGRDVAVKRLYENNFKRVDHFKNEVIILTRLRHKNLVTLYGCTSRHSRELLLVYEYVANGTVADHLHGALTKPGSLPWSTRMKIAVETASALCYLHASDVIHRDVKTNNILLDNNFCVKVADFGLSRLFPIHMTHISTAPQGTPGYVDPEYHQCYQLTDRSDVFSFGVVLIELITSMPAVDITRHRHEINLSNLAINKIQSKTLHEIVDPNIGFDINKNVRVMVLDVAELAFQSLQQGRDMRPSMQEVLDALKHIMSKDGSSGNVSELNNQADEAKLLEGRNVVFSPNSVIEGWTSSTTTPSISN